MTKKVYPVETDDIIRSGQAMRETQFKMYCKMGRTNLEYKIKQIEAYLIWCNESLHAAWDYDGLQKTMDWLKDETAPLPDKLRGYQPD